MWNPKALISLDVAYQEESEHWNSDSIWSWPQIPSHSRHRSDCQQFPLESSFKCIPHHSELLIYLHHSLTKKTPERNDGLISFYFSFWPSTKSWLTVKEQTIKAKCLFSSSRNCLVHCTQRHLEKKLWNTLCIFSEAGHEKGWARKKSRYI